MHPDVKNQSCVIICSRPVSQALLRLVPPHAFVIAADAGWQQAEKLGLAPDLVLGDFDSAPPPLYAAEILRLPAEKDDTDAFYAVGEALRRGYTQLVLLGALGGRADHTYANLQTLLYITRQGAAGLLADETTQIRCTGPGTLLLPAYPNSYLSVFAAGGVARGVCLGGVKYPLDGATLFPDTPLGTSNEFAAETASISCSEGYLFVMCTQADGILG